MVITIGPGMKSGHLHINFNINRRLSPMLLYNHNSDLILFQAYFNTLFLYLQVTELDLQYNLEYSCFDEFKIMAGMMVDSWGGGNH